MGCGLASGEFHVVLELCVFFSLVVVMGLFNFLLVVFFVCDFGWFFRYFCCKFF